MRKMNTFQIIKGKTIILRGWAILKVIQKTSLLIAIIVYLNRRVINFREDILIKKYI